MVRITGVFMVGCMYRFLGGLRFSGGVSLGNNPLLCRWFLCNWGLGLHGYLRHSWSGQRQWWSRSRWW